MEDLGGASANATSSSTASTAVVGTLVGLGVALGVGLVGVLAWRMMRLRQSQRRMHVLSTRSVSRTGLQAHEEDEGPRAQPRSTQATWYHKHNAMPMEVSVELKLDDIKDDLRI